MRLLISAIGSVAGSIARRWLGSQSTADRIHPVSSSRWEPNTVYFPIIGKRFPANVRFLKSVS